MTGLKKAKDGLREDDPSFLFDIDNDGYFDLKVDKKLLKYLT